MTDRKIIAGEELGKAAYGAFFDQYGHAGGARNINQAWEWIGEEQRAVWTAAGKAVAALLTKRPGP